MIWGHCIQYCSKNDIDFFENIVFKTIYSFHMPLFMIISGYLFFYSFSKRNFNELINYKMQSMLHPIIMCTILNFLLKQLANFIFCRPVNLFNGVWINELDSLWFLWSVLIAAVAVTISCKTTDKICWQIILLVIAFSGLNLFFPNPSLNLYMYPYFIIGFYFAKYEEKLPISFLRMKYASLVLFPIMLLFFRKKHYIYITGIFSADYGTVGSLFIDIYRWSIGLVGIIFILTVAQSIFKLLYDKNKIDLLKPICKLGENSLQIYCLSVSLLSHYLPLICEVIYTNIGNNILIDNINVYNFIYTPILAAFYVIMLYGITLLIKNINCNKIIFGK